jgi:glycosyltransferase involved in cell wall biosynthesis
VTTERPIIVTCVGFYTGANAWGADRSFLETIQNLRARGGVDCRVVFPRAGGMGYDIVRDAGFPVTVVKFKSSVSKVGGMWRRQVRNAVNRVAALRLAAVARAWGSHLIYSNTLSITAGALAARAGRLPHLWHMRELGQEDHGWTFDFGVPRMARLIAGSRGLVANSQAVADKFARLSGRRDIEVIHNGVALRDDNGATTPIRPLAGVGFRCVLAGRFAPGKGQLEAVEAIGLLRQRGVNAGLWLVGDGDEGYRSTVDAAVVRLGLTPYVQYVGYVPNPAPYLRAADAVLTCSRVEAFGRTTVEGMLAARAVVATASGGTPELIEDGRTGLLYPPGDVTALADRLQWLAADAPRREAMGRAAQAHAAVAYAPQRYADRLFEVLKRTAGTSG